MPKQGELKLIHIFLVCNLKKKKKSLNRTVVYIYILDIYDSFSVFEQASMLKPREQRFFNSSVIYELPTFYYTLFKVLKGQ